MASQANNAEPYRQHVNDELAAGEESAAIHAADRQQGQATWNIANYADGQLHYAEGRSDPDLALRGLAY